MFRACGAADPLAGLRALLTGVPPEGGMPAATPVSGDVPLGAIVNAIAARGRGLVTMMGKGGVGKTTLAAAVAAELVRRGHEVELTTAVAGAAERFVVLDTARTGHTLLLLDAARAYHREAGRQTDLRRAGIEPTAWVVNQSLHAAGVTDPLLAARAAAESHHIAEAATRHAPHLAIIPMLPEPPAGAAGLAQVFAAAAAQHSTAYSAASVVS